MALLAKTNNTIEIIGIKIPIPFSETLVSPDMFSDWYTNNPSKKKFNMMLSRPNINWDFLFLNKNIEIKDRAADPKNNPKYNILSLAKTKVSFTVVHKLKTKVKPAETPAANKR